MTKRKGFLMGIPVILLVFGMLLFSGCAAEPDEAEKEEEKETDLVKLLDTDADLDAANSVDESLVGVWVGGDGSGQASEKWIFKVTDTTGPGTIQRGDGGEPWNDTKTHDVTYTSTATKLKIEFTATGDEALPAEKYYWELNDVGAIVLTRGDKTYTLTPKSGGGGGGRS